MEITVITSTTGLDGLDPTAPLQSQVSCDDKCVLMLAGETKTSHFMFKLFLSVLWLIVTSSRKQQLHPLSLQHTLPVFANTINKQIEMGGWGWGKVFE